MNKRARRERGQVLILLVLVMTVVFMVGAVAVDLSLFLSERRGAQKDADLTALAAAQPLLALMRTSDGAPALQLEQTANARAADYVQQNGVTDLNNAHTPVPGSSQFTECWGGNSDVIDSYPIDVEHPTRTIFGRIFGIFSSNGLGAHARACIGSVVTAHGIMPIGVPLKDPPNDPNNGRVLCWQPDSNGDGLPDPLYGKQCSLSVTGPDKVSGEAGWLDLANNGQPTCYRLGGPGGANNITTIIAAGGANTTCSVGDDSPAVQCPNPLPNAPNPLEQYNWCVPKAPVATNPMIKAFNTLISPHPCDTNGNGIDDFTEAIELVSGTPETPSAFYRAICNSPRQVTLIIVDNFTSAGNPPLKIRAFASFFIEACRFEKLDKDGNVLSSVDSTVCDPPPGTPIGQVDLVGRFINILGEGRVGPLRDFSPKRIILDQ